MASCITREMPVDKLDGLEIRHLKYFLAVARRGTISGAAEELRIAQPSLSEQIHKLERRTGVKLFVRTARGVELTPSGEVFRQGIEQILVQLRTVITSAGSATSGLRIGVCAGVAPEVLAEIEDAIASTLPSTTGVKPGGIVFRSVPSSQQLKLLQQAELDFGIIRLPVEFSGALVATVLDQELGVVLHVQHPLADRQALCWHDLHQQQLLWFDTRRAPDYAKKLLAQINAGGWFPRLYTASSDRHALFTHVLQANNDVVAMRPQSAVQGDPRLMWRPLSEPEVPHELLGLVALKETGYASTLRAVANARNWPLND